MTQLLSTDLYLEARRSARRAWFVAVAALVVAGVAVGSVAALAPLKTNQAYLVMVDKTTGEAERVAAVDKVNLTEIEALTEAELVSYVSDRETFDVAGGQARVDFVQERSAENALTTLKEMWAPNSPTSPANLYSADDKVLVRVQSISHLSDGIAQVRFTKTLRSGRDTDRSAAFVAVIQYEFKPRVERLLERLWANPLGFTVTSYRIDAETLQSNNIFQGSF